MAKRSDGGDNGEPSDLRRLLVAAAVEYGDRKLVPSYALALPHRALTGARWRYYWLDRRNELRRERRAKGQCVRCGYDLRGNVSGVCPECGDSPAGGQ